MKKFIKCLLVVILLTPFSIYSQSKTINSYELRQSFNLLEQEQKNFNQFIRQLDFDPNVKASAERFVMNDLDELKENIHKDKDLSNEEKWKAARSMQFFITSLKTELNRKKFSVYKIPAAMEAYRELLPVVMNDDPVEDIVKDLNWRTLQLLSNSFWQFPAGKYLENLTTYRRIKSSPQFILSFLESNPEFIFRDSLLTGYASQYPNELLDYLKTRQNTFSNNVRNIEHPAIQQIVLLTKNINATEIVPFTGLIVNNNITIDSILKSRRDVTRYFQLLVDNVISNNQLAEVPPYQKALMGAINDKSLSFYVKEINFLHNEKEAVRFASVNDLRPQDLYYIITSSAQDMYTSTYLGLYRRLMEQIKNSPSDTLFSMVEYDQFRKFISVAANYNTLMDFFKRMPVETAREVLHYFIAEIDMDTLDDDELIAEVMNVADAFLALSKDPELGSIVRAELNKSLANYKEKNIYHGVRVFQILNQAYDAIAQNDDAHKLRSIYNYENISIGSLLNNADTIYEVVLFYGDEDGINSYKSFMNIFKDTALWKQEFNTAWTTITSLQGQPLTIFANLPLDYESKQDLSAQDSLFYYLSDNQINPSILMHRGHSYHLSNTLKRLTPYTKLAVLGSCGGYNNIKQIVSANPEIQIIASKQMGAMAVNDPMLHAINNRLIEGSDLHWEPLWNSLEELFKNDAGASRLFEEYVPPYKNVGVFVYRLYNADQ
ncbi:MAG: hypothetical protein H0V30_10370 [Chitinophagaceae bacterium]|nr:hypothetical protein [Chitinophagaceae bacterium]